MIIGVTIVVLSHSGCKYSLHSVETSAACFCAQSKSDLLNTTTFSSFAKGMISGNGALNFLGERQILSHSPDIGLLPDVSILFLNPFLCNACVNPVQSCIKGSTP